jgi:hypothetical protein
MSAIPNSPIPTLPTILHLAGGSSTMGSRDPYVKSQSRARKEALIERESEMLALVEKRIQYFLAR